MKNVKKIANDLHDTIKDDNFESFIAEQILSLKSSVENEPLVSLHHKSASLDVWKDGSDFVLVKSSALCLEKTENFNKMCSKEDMINEITSFLQDIL